MGVRVFVNFHMLIIAIDHYAYRSCVAVPSM